SQETEPSFGWNYDFLALAGKIRSEDLAREIVREYNAFCRDYFAEQEFFQSDVTLAAVDLSHAEELQTALDALFAKAGEDVSGKYNDLAKARVKTHGFGRASTGSEYDLVDLISLMDQMPEKYSKETETVRGIVEKAVLVSGANIGESCGLSLFYPYYNKNYYKKAWKEEYEELGTIPSYTSFLSRYEQVWLGTDLKDLFNDALVLQEGKDSQTFTMQLTDAQAEQFASARYYILRKEGESIYALVFTSGDVTEKKGLLTANFGGNVIYFSDNFGEKDIPPTRMYDTVDGVTNYTITANRQNGSMLDDDMETQIVDVQIAVNEETGELTVKGIYLTQTEEEITSGKREPIDLNYWKEIQFFNITGRYLTRDEEDRILPYWSWPEGGWIVWHEIQLANGLNFTYEPIYDDGREYFIMFEVADVQNNRYSSELLPITLADAPAEAAAADTREMNWESGNEFVFLDEQGATAGLRLLRKASNGSIMLQGYATAGEEYPVDIDLDDLVINDTISLGSQSVYLWPEAGETKTTDLTSVMEVCRLAGVTVPESISFTLTLSRSDTDAYLIHKQPYVIRFGEGLEPQIQRVPVLGAQAESQVLTETDGVRVELLDLGGVQEDQYNDPGMTAAYKIT
ncbi:MAG: hypothetical protein IKG59_06870, partial [Firmicutes bacterium]|nr:hypothetical protein [Bacillota bacterium]